jgi:hypothetical protein
MKAILSMLLAAGAFASAEQSVAPQRFPANRYEKLKVDSPFAPATAPEKPVDPGPSVFQNLYLGSAAKMREDGVDKEWIVVRDRSDIGRIMQLSGTEPNSEGFQLVNIEWSDDPKKIKAKIKKGTEFGTLESDQGAWGSPGAGVLPSPVGARPAGSPRPGVPSVPIPNGNTAIRPPQAIPGRGPAIPRPTNIPQPGVRPQAYPQANPAQNADPRKRIRVINSK